MQRREPLAESAGDNAVVSTHLTESGANIETAVLLGNVAVLQGHGIGRQSGRLLLSSLLHVAAAGARCSYVARWLMKVCACVGP